MIKKGNKAPQFSFEDIQGTLLSNETLKGKKVYITFHRFVACPICNLRFRQVEATLGTMDKENVVAISIYESTPENMLQYIGDEQLTSLMVSDISERLYQLFSVKISKFGKFMSLFHGVMKKVKEGKRLFKNRVKLDGNQDRMGAEFIINEEGIVELAHYHSYLGNDYPIDKIKTLLT